MVTEVDIRTPRLTNVTFLLPYRGRAPIAAARAHLLIALGAAPAPVGALASKVAGAMGCDPAQVLPTLWGMVARREVRADFDQPLTMNSLLHLPERGRS